MLYASYRNLQTGGALETAARVATASALRRNAEASHEDNGPEDDGPGGGLPADTEEDMMGRGNDEDNGPEDDGPGGGLPADTEEDMMGRGNDEVVREVSADLYDRYENQNGEDKPWMSENELIDRIEEELPYGIETKELFAKIDEYRRLDEEDFNEGRRDFSGSERENVFRDIMAELERLSKERPIRLAVSDSSVSREKNEIKARSQANGTFMKAPNGQPTNNLDGKAVRINVSNNNGYYYLTNEQIVSTNNQPAKLRHSRSADDAALWQFEATGGNNQYYIFTYINGTKKYMNISRYNRTDNNLYLSDSPQALTASRRNDGKYVIYANNNGNNCYVDLWAGGSSEGFAAYAASNPNANQQLTFDFSTPAGQQYAVIVHYNDAYYVVEEDGTLIQVNYDPEAKAVEMDNPVLWNYQAGERNLLSSVTDGRTFGGPGGTADSFYYKYIDAAADDGIFTEDSSHPDGKYESGFVFENNRMRSTSNTSKYLGVEVDSSGIPVRISGNANFGDAVEVLHRSRFPETQIPVML